MLNPIPTAQSAKSLSDFFESNAGKKTLSSIRDSIFYAVMNGETSCKISTSTLNFACRNLLETMGYTVSSADQCSTCIISWAEDTGTSDEV